jgi:hypothetical protein
MMQKKKRRNKEIVLDYMLKSGDAFFKCRILSRNIKELSPAQVANGLRALHEEGIIEQFNNSYTWVLTKREAGSIEEKI